MAILNHGSTLRTADGGQTTTTIVTAANIGTYGVATNSTYYVGTTQNIFNRASGAQTLTGVSIDGNAATVTNGLTTGNYNSYALPLAGGTLTGNLTITKASAYLYLNGTNSDAELRFLANSSDRWAMGMNVGDATENLNIYNYTTATTNFTILKASGNVGVGTASPSYKLDVSGAINASTYVYAGVFYDNDNTVYYTNPSGTSNLVGLTVANTITGSVSGNAATATNVAWTGITGGARTNYLLEFQPPANSYAGFAFKTSAAGEAGYFLVKGTADGDVYTAEGITLVADAGWLTLAQRTTASRGVKIMTGTTSLDRFKITTAGDVQIVNGNTFTYNSNVVLHAGNYGGYSTFSGSVTSTYGNFTTPGLIIGDAQYGFYVVSGNVYYKSASGGVHYWRNTANSGNTMSLDNSGNLNVSGYLQTTGNLIYPSTYGVTQRLEVSNAANNAWIDGLTIAPGGIVTAYGDSRAPIFYDSNDTAYYVNPNSSSNLSILRVFSAFDTASSDVYANMRVMRNNATNDGMYIGYGNLGSTGGITRIFGGGATTGELTKYIDYTLEPNSFRAPIFYDSNDTAYYTDPNGTSVLNRLKIDGGNFANNYFQSLSDFVSGTLVTTDIPASAANGLSFVMNVIGKSYSSASPFDFNVQGYLYNSTIINYSGMSLDSTGLSTIKVFENGGFLCFWWARVSYWNAFEVSVRSYDAAKTNYNRVTNITDVVEPTGTKKVTVTLHRFMRADASATNSVDLRAPIFYDSDNTVYYVNPNSTSNLYDLTLSGGKHTYLSINPGNSYEAMVQYTGGTGSAWYVGKRTSSQLVGTDNFHFYSAAAGATVGGIDTSGNIFSTGSVRSPIFYDSNDTAYYVDPASTSILNGTRHNTVVAGSTSAMTSAGQLAIYSSVNPYISFHDGGVGRTAYMQETGGIFYFGEVTYTESEGSFRAPLFYDSNNTAYYLDPASTSNLNNITAAGTLTVTNIAKNSTSPIVINSGLSASLGLRVYYDMHLYNTLVFTDSAWNSQGAISGSSGVLNISAANATSNFTKQAGYSEEGGSFRAPIFYDSNNTAYYLDAANSTTSLLVAGKVGIGTVSPLGLLEVRGTNRLISNDGLLQVNSNNNAGIDLGGSISFGGVYASASVTEWAQLSGRKETATSGEYGGYLDFATRPHLGLNTSRIRITSTGNVGIGTTSPTGKLHVYNSAATDTTLESGTSGTTGKLIFKTSDNADLNKYIMQESFYMILNGHANEGFKFRDSASNVLLSIFGAANAYASRVGIGTQTPAQKLHVSGIGYSDTDFRAPIFYDSANTAYYVDPAGTSNLNALVLSGASYFRPQTWIQMDGSYGMYWPNTNGCHIEGNTLSSYGSLAIRGTRGGWKGIHFYEGGNVPHLMFDGSANGGVYFETGGRWASYYSYAANCWGFGTSSTNSAYNVYAPTGVYSGGRVDGTIFYDSNDTAYYLDPANSGTSLLVAGKVGIGTTSPTYKLQIGTVGSLDDSIRIGTYQVAKNTRQYIGYTRHDSGLFESAGSGDTPSTVLGGVAGIRIVNTEGTLYAPQADNSVQLLTHIYNGGSRVALHANYDGKVGVDTASPSYKLHVVGTAYSDTDFRAPIFYDSNNTAYYVDPNSTSNLVGLTVANTITGSISGNSGTVGGLSVHSGRNNEVNKVVRTDGSGYIQAGWINTDSGDSGFATRLTRITCSTDNYLRYLGLIDFKVSIGGSGKNNYSRRVDYTSDVNYHVGSFGHNGYGANETFHGGSGFIDIWAGTNYPSGLSHIHGFNALHYTVNSLGTTGGAAYGWQMVAQYDSDSGPWWRRCSGGSFSSWLRLVSYGNNQSGTIYASDFYDNDNTAYYINAASTSNLAGLTVVNTITGSITGNAGGSSASCTGNAVTATTSTNVSSPDGDRNPSTKLPTTNARNVRFDFSGAGAVGGTGNYAGVMTYAPWDGTSASTGDSSYQLAFLNETGVNASGVPGLSLRNGINSTWGSWYRIITSGNIASQTVATAGLATKATRANGNFYIDDNYGNTVVGAYSASRYQGVYAMGDSYKLAADGSTTGSLYGIAWSHPNAGGAAGNLSNHGALILINGGYAAAISSSIRCTVDMRTPIYYDSDNTAYYIDAGSTSYLYVLSVASAATAADYYTAGWFRSSASGNGMYNQVTGQHFYSDSVNYWNVASSASTQGIRFRTGGHAGTVRGYIIADTNNDVGLLNQDGNWRVRVVSGDYTIFDGSSIRAQIFYDSNDTGYYTDPAGTSILNVVRANSYVQKSASQSLSGTVGCTIDVAAAGIHVLTLAASTTISSFTYNYRAPNPSVNTIMLVIKYGGTASITWTNVLWANGVTPTITGVSGYADVYMLTSYQGTTGVWIGTVVSQGVVSTSL